MSGPHHHTPEVELLLEQGRKHEESLSNGHRGNAEAMSDGIVHLIQVNRYQLRNHYVPDDICKDRMKQRGTPWSALKVIGSVSVVCLTILQIVRSCIP